MIKRCIIFDNEDQSESILKLVRDGKHIGIEIECEQFNVGSTELTEVLTNGEIDIEKVVKEFSNRFSTKTFHLAAFDWQLDDKIDGVELIRQLTHYRILKNTPKIIFSGLLGDILKDILKSGDNKSQNKLTTLVNGDIKGFFKREKYDNDILNILSTSDESVELIIEEELKKFPGLIFKNSFISKKFNGKTFLEIAEFLKDNDSMRNEFKKEIIQQVIAYLTEKI